MNANHIILRPQISCDDLSAMISHTIVFAPHPSSQFSSKQENHFLIMDATFSVNTPTVDEIRTSKAHYDVGHKEAGNNLRLKRCNSLSNICRSPRSPSIPIEGRTSPVFYQQHQLHGNDAADFQDLRFYNRVVSGIKNTTKKKYQCKELLEQNELCLENIMQTREARLKAEDNLGNVSDENDVSGKYYIMEESEDEEDQFVLDL